MMGQREWCSLPVSSAKLDETEFGLAPLTIHAGPRLPPYTKSTYLPSRENVMFSLELIGEHNVLL